MKFAFLFFLFFSLPAFACDYLYVWPMGEAACFRIDDRGTSVRIRLLAKLDQGSEDERWEVRVEEIMNERRAPNYEPGAVALVRPFYAVIDYREPEVDEQALGWMSSNIADLEVDVALFEFAKVLSSSQTLVYGDDEMSLEQFKEVQALNDFDCRNELERLGYEPPEQPRNPCWRSFGCTSSSASSFSLIGFWLLIFGALVRKSR